MTKLQFKVFTTYLRGNGYDLSKMSVGQYGVLYNSYRKTRRI